MICTIGRTFSGWYALKLSRYITDPLPDLGSHLGRNDEVQLGGRTTPGTRESPEAGWLLPWPLVLCQGAGSSWQDLSASDGEGCSLFGLGD